MKSLLKLSRLVSVVVGICCGVVIYGFYKKSDSAIRSSFSYKSAFDGSHLDGVDSVKYVRLTPNKEYTVDCSVYIRQFNKDIGGYVDTPAVLSDGTHIKGSTTFVADGSEGIVDVALKGDISQDVTGKMLVVYEKIR